MGLGLIGDANLVQTVKELRYLVGVLLAQSGLDQEGIIRAFDMAEIESKKLDDAMMKIVAAEFHQTPEGQEARRIAEDELKRRRHEAWRRWCIDEVRIVPPPRDGS